MENLLTQIKQRRKELGFTQADMRMCIGMSRQQYQRLEAKGNPRFDNLELIAKGLKSELMLIPSDRLQEVQELLKPNSDEDIGTAANNHWEEGGRP